MKISSRMKATNRQMLKPCARAIAPATPATNSAHVA